MQIKSHGPQINRVEDQPKESSKISQDGIDGNKKGNLISGPIEVQNNIRVERK